MVDHDMGGVNPEQKIRAFCGFGRGWQELVVNAQRYITAAGTYAILPSDNILLVNVVGSVTIQLPDLNVYGQLVTQPWGFGQKLWIKDFGGNAASFPIVVVPFGLQTIDLVGGNFSIVQSRQLVRLYSMNDLTGWWSG